METITQNGQITACIIDGNIIEIGDLCTVKHHYGHTATDKQMRVMGMSLDSRCNCGLRIYVDGLDWGVDAGLIVPKPFSQFKIRYAVEKGAPLQTDLAKGYCSYDARLRFRKLFPHLYISSVREVNS